MMAHPIVMAAALAGLTASLLVRSSMLAAASLALVALLAVERFVAGMRAARRFQSATPLVFPLLHLGRDAAWVAAIAVWMLRRTLRRPPDPSHSMRPRAVDEAPFPS
jgi:hypothetical protein